MENIVEFDNVSLTYHSQEGETLAIDELSFAVKQNELFGIVGPSGCGKTTILSLISSILSPTAGGIKVCGSSPQESRENIGYMLQKDELFNWRTIFDNIMLGLEIRKQKTTATKAYAMELLEKYNLAEFAKYYPTQLSGGMRQRVALIRTLVLSPKLLLLDEPFSALDFQSRLKVVNDVHSIIKTEEKTAVFVTHDISEAISMCDRIIVLSNRPSKVKCLVELNTFGNISPLERREHKDFAPLFDKIWKNLQYDTEKKNDSNIKGTHKLP
ncbi:MAG: ATP-binding cassette domain-containing protein [Clostridia bacterium]